VEGDAGGELVVLVSDDDPDPVRIPVDVTDPRVVEPLWGRFVAGVVHELRPRAGFVGRVRTTVPIGAGLSSSAALEVATALALGFEGTTTELALLCQRAEQAGTGVPCGVMDQLASAAGLEGHALLIDCTTLDVRPVPLPDDVDVVVVHSGQARALASSAYAERRRECEAAAAVAGSLRDASLEDVAAIPDALLRRRARHVVTENRRVRDVADALADGRVADAGTLLVESHASLRDDFDVSTPALDALVTALVATDGVLGARLTGAGFGGCVVALVRPGVDVGGWRVRAADGASTR